LLARISARAPVPSSVGSVPVLYALDLVDAFFLSLSTNRAIQTIPTCASHPALTVSIPAKVEQPRRLDLNLFRIVQWFARHASADYGRHSGRERL
jgi:hypothetical protein